MELSRNDIYRIIIEEYIREEGLVERQDIEDLLKSIMGSEKYCERFPEKCQPPEDGRGGDTASMPKPMKPRPLSSLETMPFPDEEGEDVESRIVNLLAQLEPEEAVKIINNIVFQNYPQYMQAAPDEEGPDPDRPVILSPGDPRRKAIREMILKILREYEISEQASIYHDFSDEPGYTPEELEQYLQGLEDRELLAFAEKDGIETRRFINKSTGEWLPSYTIMGGGRDALIRAIKDV